MVSLLVVLTTVLLVFSPLFQSGSSAQTCPGAAPTRLTVGGQGQRIPGEVSSNVRNQPTTRGEFLGQIPPNGIFTVLEGPVCADGYAWWRVNYEGLFGWTPEGFPGDYWLRPYPLAGATPMPAPTEIAMPPSEPMLSPEVDVSEVLAVFADREAIAFMSGVNGESQIFLMDTEAETIIRVPLPYFYGSNPVWSPDGTQLMFSSYNGINTFNLQSGEYRTLITNMGYWQYVWSPSGTQIAFVTQDSGDDEIYAFDLITEELRNLTQSPAFEGSPSYSPDGAFIAFSSLELDSDTSHIYVMPADGSAAMYRVTDETVYEYYPVWSPDGSLIAYLRNGQLALVDPESGTPRVLATDLDTPFELVWSPDGQFIAVLALSNSASLYVVDVASGDTTLIDAGVYSLPVSWSPDSTQLVYQGEGEFVYRINRDGSNRVALTRTEEYVAIPRWRPRN